MSDTLLTLDQAAALIPGADAGTLKQIDVLRSPSEDASEIENMLCQLRGVPIVYFLGFRECVKIGYSVNIAGRFRALSVLPEPLAIFHIERGTRDDEAQYHHDFRRYRLYSEWFAHCGRLAEFIATKRHSIVFES